MGTVPTGLMERELRALYLRWLHGVTDHQQDIATYVSQFEVDSRQLIELRGGQAASLGALTDFPVPKTLALSPVADVVYNQMQQAAIKASITAGLGATDAARQMLHAGLGQSFNRLNRLARTETVRAYWGNSWDSIEGLGLVMVWSAEHGPRTCDYCLSRDGLVVEDRTIFDHPNGRCTLVAKLASQVKYKGTLMPGKQAAKPVIMHTEVVSAPASKQAPSIQPPTQPAKKAIQNVSQMTPQDKVKTAEQMYGTGSPQHVAAVQKFTPDAKIAAVGQVERDDIVYIGKTGQVPWRVLSVKDDKALLQSPNGGITSGQQKRTVSLDKIVKSPHRYDPKTGKIIYGEKPAPVPALVPEEKYVANLQSMLQSGKLTVEELSQQASTASALGQANAREAIARHEAAEAAKRQISKGTRDLPGISEEFKQRIIPPKSGSFSRYANDEKIKALKATPEGDLVNAMRAFQDGGSSIARLRNDTQRYITAGTEAGLNPTRQVTVEQLLGAINQIPAPEKLWRGMRIQGSAEDVLAKYAAGTDVDIAMGSFTSQRSVADRFVLNPQGGRKVDLNKSVPVRFEWADDHDMTGLPLQNVSTGSQFYAEKEWVVGGRFKTVDAKMSQGTVVVRITRTEKW